MDTEPVADQPSASSANALRITAILCIADVLGLVGITTFVAQLPAFQALWSLSNSGAGIIAGALLTGYMATAAISVTLTDRIDGRIIFSGLALLAALANFGFALFAGGFWTALIFQILLGVGIAGVYMPGLKILSDRIGGPRQSRFVAFYTATFSVGAALSFWSAGELNTLFGWQWTFAAAGICAVVSALMVWFLVPAAERSKPKPETHWLDFRPVLRNRQAMTYILGYAGHCWELFALRSWIVAYLVWVASQNSGDNVFMTAAKVASVLSLLGLFASIGGNEFAMRFGRKRVVVTVMVVSFLLAVGLGASASLSYGMVALVAIIYSLAVMSDSASLSAGAVAAADPRYRGAVLAVHTTFGTGAAFLGTLVVGIILDLAGGASSEGWLAAFAVVGAGSLAGAAAVLFLGRETVKVA